MYPFEKNIENILNTLLINEFYLQICIVNRDHSLGLNIPEIYKYTARRQSIHTCAFHNLYIIHHQIVRLMR